MRVPLVPSLNRNDSRVDDLTTISRHWPSPFCVFTQHLKHYFLYAVRTPQHKFPSRGRTGRNDLGFPVAASVAGHETG